MIRKVHNNLYIGDITSCNYGREELVVKAGFKMIHACREPCFNRIRIADEEASLISGNEQNRHSANSFPTDLFLDMVDSKRTKDFSIDMFKIGISFIEKNIGKAPTESILIHCAEGRSRSAALALLYLAKNDKIFNGSYLLAHKEYVRKDDGYYPGTGIMDFMAQNWIELMSFDYEL